MNDMQSGQISLSDWTTNSLVSEKANQDDFQEVCRMALQKLDLPEGFANWQQNKGSLVLKFASSPVLGIVDSKKGRRIEIRTSRLPAIKAGLPLDAEEDILNPEMMEQTALLEALRQYFDQVIDQLGGDRFACCSKYRQCSAAGSCIQSDRLLAIDCDYRRNLKAGQNYFA